MENTLIIHPKDETTQFLDIVYNPIPNKTIITGGLYRKEIHELIEGHDRVMMCGHGSPGGLFSVGQFPSNNFYVINDNSVGVLKKKNNSIFIWCNADKFVRKHNLKGFFSGMFISELYEATYCRVMSNQDDVDESNYGFCNLLSECINEPIEDMYQSIIEGYGEIAKRNPVAKFNHDRLYLLV